MEMLKAAEQSPVDKAAHIQDIFSSMGFEKEPTLKAWDAKVSSKLMTVSGTRPGPQGHRPARVPLTECVLG